MEIDDVLLEALRVPERQTNSLAVDFRFEVMWYEVARMRNSAGFVFVLESLRSFLGRQGKGRLEELEERGLAGVARADDEDATNKGS